MSSRPAPARRGGILGFGHFLPANTRDNDDPIFDYIKTHVAPGTDLFKGYDIRHVLGPGETMTDLLVPAAQRALSSAGLPSTSIDMLLGYASVSEFEMPNALARVHSELGLKPGAWIVPINNEYANFNASLVMANGLIRAGQIDNALIVVAGNWTRVVDYKTPESVSAGDGAGAAVLGLSSDATTFEVIDFETQTQSDDYGVMFVQPDRVGEGPDGEPTFSKPYFHITPAGFAGFASFGENVPPQVVNRLLARNALRGSDIALIAHQTSAVLNDAWTKAIEPAQFLQTLSTFANMTLASIPVNLSFFRDEIQSDHVVLLALGPELSTNAVLLRRSRPT
jgi:3-oxoacyl-[acyl-carrier-protein] synthase-3